MRSTKIPHVEGYGIGKSIDIVSSAVDGSIILACQHVLIGEGAQSVGRVHVLSREGALVRTMGEGVLSWHLGAVCVSMGGDICVTDNERRSVVIFDRKGALVREIGVAGSGIDPIPNCVGIAVSGEGKIILSESFRNRVRVIGAT